MKKISARPIYLKGVWHGAFASTTVFLFGMILDGRRRKNLEKNNASSEKGETEDDKIVKLNRGREILKYGEPDSGKEIRYYSNHVLMYDQQKRIPTWVAEHISADILKGSANRKYAQFRPDPDVKPMFSAQNHDYWKSGWSRGHMAPAGNNKLSQVAMQDSFNLSNVVPQNLENNAGFWNRFEMYCRDLTKKYSNVYIISGPIMLPTEEDGGKKYIKYQVIGENNVAVPTHLFKVVIVEDKNRNVQAVGSFVVPNEPIGYGHELKEYQVDLSLLERELGVELVPKMSELHKYNGDLCKVDGCKLMNRNEFELYFIGRKLQSANTLHRLETVWSELEEKKLKPDQYLIDLYKERKGELAKEKHRNEE